MDTDEVSTRDSDDDLNRLVALTERKHELWEALARCEDEELRRQLFDQLAAYREELARLREIVSSGLGDSATTPLLEQDAPQPIRSVGEVLRSSLLLPSDEPIASSHAVDTVVRGAAGSQRREAERGQPELVPTPVAAAEESGTSTSDAPPAVATALPVADVSDPVERPHRTDHVANSGSKHSRSSDTLLVRILAAVIAVSAVALVAWVLFLRPGGSTDTPQVQTTTTLATDTEVSAIDQIRAVLDGLGYGSVVIEERSGTIHLGGLVASEKDRDTVIGASQALTRGMPLDSGSLAVSPALDVAGGEAGQVPSETSAAAIVETPVASGPYIEATLEGKDFVLAGVVPSAELAGQYLQAAEMAYSPYVRSELEVDEQLEQVEWLSRGPGAIVLLPMIIEGRISISDGQVQVSGRSPDEAGVERLQAALSQTMGLPVGVDDVEVANLEAPTYVIAADAGVVELTGRVPTDEIRNMLVEAAAAAYGAGNVDDQITVDPKVYPALWMYSAGPLMQAMSTFPDYELHIDGMAFSGFINGGVTFESNSATFSGDYAQVLDVGVGVLTRDPSLQLVIEGHTDNQGSDEANLALSQLRAEAVRDYFIANGIDASRLTAVGFGETKPVVSNDTAEGRARNRRIEYVLSTAT